MIIVSVSGQQVDTGDAAAAAKKAKLVKQQEERKKTRRVLESCLTLVRSLYTREEKTIQDYVMSHPTQVKERLMNKILANMMIHCRDHISPDQVETL